jgi:hypothetical protein
MVVQPQLNTPANELKVLAEALKDGAKNPVTDGTELQGVVKRNKTLKYYLVTESTKAATMPIQMPTCCRGVSLSLWYNLDIMSPRIGSMSASAAKRSILMLASAKFRQKVPPVPRSTSILISSFVLRVMMWVGNLLRIPSSKRQLIVKTTNSRTTQKRTGPSFSINGT